jgi:hypothetical protein
MIKSEQGTIIVLVADREIRNVKDNWEGNYHKTLKLPLATVNRIPDLEHFIQVRDYLSYIMWHVETPSLALGKCFNARFGF